MGAVISLRGISMLGKTMLKQMILTASIVGLGCGAHAQEPRDFFLLAMQTRGL
jgi:hypothetical protein